MIGNLPSQRMYRGASAANLRHEQLLKEAGEALEQARTAASLGIPHEMLLLDLYAALRPIDGITGATTADDILNRIFSTFCIGPCKKPCPMNSNPASRAADATRG